MSADVSQIHSSPAGNRTLSSAKVAKQDEFYTQLGDIENELKHYREHLRGKVVLCNCDDPFESKFFKYFAGNFNFLRLKKLIATSYDGSSIAGQEVLFEEYSKGNGKREKPKAVAIELTEVRDETGDGATGIADVKLFLERNPHTRTELDASETYGGGDFRSPQCVEFLKQADIVVTNPPFSLFREYVALLVEHGKQFVIIGNKNAITLKEFFKLIKENKIWIGVTPMGVDMLFNVPEHVVKALVKTGKEGSKYKIVNGKVMGRSTSAWFTNMDHNRRHELLRLGRKYSPGEYPAFDKYDAINVNRVVDIPVDYDGAMGVPITFIDKYNPDQFAILSSNDLRKTKSVPYKEHGLIKDKDSAINGKPKYVRIVVRRRS